MRLIPSMVFSGNFILLIDGYGVVFHTVFFLLMESDSADQLCFDTTFFGGGAKTDGMILPRSLLEYFQ